MRVYSRLMVKGGQRKGGGSAARIQASHSVSEEAQSGPTTLRRASGGMKRLIKVEKTLPLD